MARFNANEINNYGTSSGGKVDFFSLKNDKDVATVRIMYEKAEDIEGYSVHRVQVGDKERYVNCIREYNDPIDKCPFCAAKLPVQAKLFVPLYNEDLDKVQFWERGKTFYSQLSGLCSRYPNIVSRTFDIERNGKPRDTKTTYQFYPVGDADGTTIEDILADLEIETMPSPLGGIILDKTAEEMQAYLRDGDFPENGSAPVKRRARAEEPEDEMPVRRGRRTPAGSDTF